MQIRAGDVVALGILIAFVANGLYKRSVTYKKIYEFVINRDNDKSDASKWAKKVSEERSTFYFAMGTPVYGAFLAYLALSRGYAVFGGILAGLAAMSSAPAGLILLFSLAAHDPWREVLNR